MESRNAARFSLFAPCFSFASSKRVGVVQGGDEGVGMKVWGRGVGVGVWECGCVSVGVSVGVGKRTKRNMARKFVSSSDSDYSDWRMSE